MIKMQKILGVVWVCVGLCVLAQADDDGEFIDNNNNDPRDYKYASKVFEETEVPVEEISDELFEAIEIGDADQVLEILKKCPELVNFYNHGYGGVPVHRASQKGNLDVFQILVKYGADVFADTDHGRTIFHYIVQGGSVDLFEYVLSLVDFDKRKDLLETKDRSGRTLVDEVVECMHMDLIRHWAFSEDYRCLLREPFADNATIFHFAVLCDFLECVEFILNEMDDVDVNARDDDGLTALHYVLEVRNIKLIELFFQYRGAVGVNGRIDWSICLPNGQAPVDLLRKIISDFEAELNEPGANQVRIKDLLGRLNYIIGTLEAEANVLLMPMEGVEQLHDDEEDDCLSDLYAAMGG